MNKYVQLSKKIQSVLDFWNQLSVFKAIISKPTVVSYH